MKKSSIIGLVALSILLLFGVNFAAALEPIPKESGFSGFIRPGVGYLNYKSNMVASFLGNDLSDKKINSLDDSPDSQSTGIALVPFSLQYTFASTRTQLFLGTDLTDLILSLDANDEVRSSTSSAAGRMRVLAVRLRRCCQVSGSV